MVIGQCVLYSLQVEDIHNGDLSLAKYGLEAAATQLELTNQVSVLCVIST